MKTLKLFLFLSVAVLVCSCSYEPTASSNDYEIDNLQAKAKFDSFSESWKEFISNNEENLNLLEDIVTHRHDNRDVHILSFANDEKSYYVDYEKQ